MENEIKERMHEALVLAEKIWKDHLAVEGKTNVFSGGYACRDSAIATLATKIYDELRREEMEAIH